MTARLRAMGAAMEAAGKIEQARLYLADLHRIAIEAGDADAAQAAIEQDAALATSARAIGAIEIAPARAEARP